MPALPENRIHNWLDCRAFMAADYYSRSGRRPVIEFVMNPVVRFLVLLRIAEWLLNIGAPFIVRAPLMFWFRRLSMRCGFSISLNVFGPGIALPHYGPLMVHQDACIGRNCRIHIGTVIAGSAVIMDPAEVPEFDAPIIGDNVYIGPGVKMSGPLRIASDCAIGANSVVTHSFNRPGVMISGFPAKIVGLQGSQDMLVRGCDFVPALRATESIIDDLQAAG
ncbi:MAG: serine acetyltransferase [Sphingomonadales bacterium]|uniref:serine O-acetyltransferase n=2 Tax=Sphingorhabdus sp. TaxID=1902408 RepID=UPI003C7319F7|nr:serine acetyltransferase [Sphingomonadales bacterium]